MAYQIILYEVAIDSAMRTLSLINLEDLNKLSVTKIRLLFLDIDDLFCKYPIYNTAIS